MSWTRFTGAGIASLAATAATPVLAAGEEGGGSLPQLDVTTFPTQIFWLLVTFVVLYVLIAKVAAPRIGDVLEERQQRISNDLEKAESLKDEIDGVRAEYEKALADARNEAHGVLVAAQNAASEANSKAEAAAGEKAAKQAAEAEARIAAAKSEALGNIRSVAVEVAGDAVHKLIGVKADETAVSEAVDAAAGGRS